MHRARAENGQGQIDYREPVRPRRQRRRASGREVEIENAEMISGANLQPRTYWRLWLFDTLLVTAGLLFFLATHYGTYEFFGSALSMALLPLIPILVLVGGGGSTVFALTKVF